MVNLGKGKNQFSTADSSKKETAKKVSALQEILRQKDTRLNQLEHICDELAAGMLRFNFNTEALEISHSMNKVFTNCLPDNELSIKNLIESVPAEDRGFIQELFSLPKGGKKRIAGQFKLVQKSKDSRETRFFQISGSYDVQANDEIVLTCIIRDATKEIKQIRDLQRNLERSEESDRIKTNFLLNISHIIRTPMNSILGFAELLSMTDLDPTRRKEYTQVIKKQSKNLIRLIDDVAEIARYESGSMTITKTPVNINLLLNDIIKDIDAIRSASRKEHVKVSLETPSKEGMEIYTDGGRLHQIIVNLVNHSLKYTAEGSIELGYKLGDENRIDFFVKDTSPGLTREELKTLFDQFTILDKSEYNRYDDETGLGLSIARSIVKLLGGRLTAESDETSGVTFHFSLPYEPIPSPTRESIEDEIISSQYRWPDKVILIVEDEEVNGLFLEAVLQETGARTLYAKNGSEAVELCRSINKIDLILMDIKMPVMNGIRATEEIRTFNLDIPIIAQTALSQEEDRQNCLFAGCNDVISKPIEVEELLSLVNNYFAH